jgi:hypothetical protein
MNMYYPMLPAYFQLVCLLMLAASSALLVGNYAQTLDVTKQRGLLQMVIGSVFLWSTILFTRLTHYWVVLYNLLCVFHADGHMVFFWVGVITGGCLMPLVGLAFFADASQRLVKFGSALWNSLRAKKKSPAHAPRDDIAMRSSEGRRLRDGLTLLSRGLQANQTTSFKS